MLFNRVTSSPLFSLPLLLKTEWLWINILIEFQSIPNKSVYEGDENNPFVYLLQSSSPQSQIRNSSGPSLQIHSRRMRGVSSFFLFHRQSPFLCPHVYFPAHILLSPANDMCHHLQCKQCLRALRIPFLFFLAFLSDWRGCCCCCCSRLIHSYYLSIHPVATLTLHWFGVAQGRKSHTIGSFSSTFTFARLVSLRVFILLSPFLSSSLP